ncbi:ArnT family glycosyltransferase [Rhabdothermincola salaria]|uniref:ArnT family glycosyltransferase n=1 Tax=Rhabdothermincola salaria TaxID=2903142 RepID=UPI001E593F9D|nr:glycosyltransferase family 39 protein [Rhabdothermincola salaria]MCD9624552.1 glycosyltransferase family 39 protein [Rhabdothermincola salaria]
MSETTAPPDPATAGTPVEADPTTEPPATRGLREPIVARDRRFYAWLIGITLAGLVLRVAYVWIWRRDMVVWGDGYFYHHAANLLAGGQGWINPFAYFLRDSVNQAADHPPLYILYLGGFSWLGRTGVTSHLLASTVIGAGSVFLSGLAGRQIGGWRLGLVGAGVVAVYPGVWNWDGLLLSETMAIFTTALTIWLAYRFWRAPGLWPAAAVGAAVALAALSRAELLLLSVFVIVPLCLLAGTTPWRDRILRLGAAALACIVVLAPWVTYNMTRFEQPVLLSNGFEITLATSNCEYTFYGPTTGYWSLQCSLDYLERNGFDEATGDQSVRAEILRRETLDFMGDNLDRLPVVVLARWGRITGLWKPTQQVELDEFNERMTPWVIQSAAVTWYPVAGLAIAGAVILRRRRVPISPVLGPVLVVAVVVTMFFGQARYRAVAEGAIALMAAVAIEALWWRWRSRRATSAPADADDDPTGEPISH